MVAVFFCILDEGVVFAVFHQMADRWEWVYATLEKIIVLDLENSNKLFCSDFSTNCRSKITIFDFSQLTKLIWNSSI